MDRQKSMSVLLGLGGRGGGCPIPLSAQQEDSRNGS